MCQADACGRVRCARALRRWKAAAIRIIRSSSIGSMPVSSGRVLADSRDGRDWQPRGDWQPLDDMRRARAAAYGNALSKEP